MTRFLKLSASALAGLSGQRGQRALLALLLTGIFWHGLWAGAPRADQLAYLHQAGRYDGLWELLRHAASWNRTETVGDAILFRPVLYWLLAAFTHFFRYDFMLWQAACLTLHIITVLGAHSLLSLGLLRNTPFPFLMVLLFGASLLGSELVLWNHMAGYLLFAALAVHAAYFLARHLETGRAGPLWGCLALTLLAEFTYELGVILAGLIAVTFLVRHLLRKRVGQLPAPGRPAHGPSALAWALLFACCMLLYPAASAADLWLRGITGPLSTDRLDFFAALPRAYIYAGEQISFWLGGWLFPTAYAIRASARATFTGLAAGAPLFSLNALAGFCLPCLLALRIRAVLDFFRQRAPGRLLALLATLVLAFLYSFMIAQGRAVPRGLDQVRQLNIYYAYMFYGILVAGLGFVLLDTPGTAGPQKTPAGAGHSRWPRLWTGALALLLALLILFNALGVRALTRSYRYEYSPPQQAVVDAVENWLRGPGKNGGFFALDPSCPGNPPQPWLTGGHIRRGSGWTPPFTFADALWPERSLELNKRLRGTAETGQDTPVTILPCPQPAKGACAP